MPGGVPIRNLDRARFNKGFLYATRYLSESNGATAGTADNVPMGILQNITLNHSMPKTLLMGPESLAPIAAGITEESLTYSARFGAIEPGQLATFIGGSAVHAAGYTTYTKKVNEEPEKHDIHFKTPSDGTTLEVYCYGCLVDDYTILEADNRAFFMSNVTGRVYGEGSGANDRLFRVILPGNYSGSS